MSWKETPVRLAAALAALALVAMLYLALSGVAAGRAERAFDAASVPAPATVIEIDGLTNQRARSRGDTMRVKLRMAVDGTAEPQTIEGYLPANPGATPLSVGDKLEALRVLPNDLRAFSDRRARPWTNHLWVPLVITPGFALLVAWTLLQRRAALRLWQMGELRRASVVSDAARAPLSPGVRVLKLAHSDAALGQRVFSVVCPDALGRPERGSTVDVIVDPKRPARALMADAYA
jgi:hypothetical protein